MIKCKYCKVINNKSYGTCSYCGAPLENTNNTNEYTDGDVITINTIINGYNNNVLTLEEYKRMVIEAGLPKIANGLIKINNK